MAIGDTIPENGQYTMTNLKSATTVADGRLSAHHPNLSGGSETAFGDFVCKGIGTFPGLGPDIDTRLLKCILVDSQGVSGSYNSADEWVFDNADTKIKPGVPFTIRIEIWDGGGELGQFFAEAILRDGSGLTLQSGPTSNEVTIRDVSYTLIGGGVNTNAVEIEAEVSSLVSPLVIAYEYNDPLNTNAENQGTVNRFPPSDVGLMFRTKEVESADVIITSWGMEMLYDGVTFGWEVDHNPSSDFGGANVFDPADQATNPTFKLYDGPPDSQTPFATSGDSEFLHGNHGGRLFKDVAKYPSGSEMDWYVALEDDSGTVRDVIRCTLDDGNTNVDSWPQNDGSEEHYTFTSNKSRDSGTEIQPHVMTLNDSSFS